MLTAEHHPLDGGIQALQQLQLLLGFALIGWVGLRQNHDLLANQT